MTEVCVCEFCVWWCSESWLWVAECCGLKIVFITWKEPICIWWYGRSLYPSNWKFQWCSQVQRPWVRVQWFWRGIMFVKFEMFVEFGIHNLSMWRETTTQQNAINLTTFVCWCYVNKTISYNAKINTVQLLPSHTAPSPGPVGPSTSPDW